MRAGPPAAGQVGRKELQATFGRFELGEVTRTDVAQAKSRLNDAISKMEKSAADLSVSRQLRSGGRPRAETSGPSPGFAPGAEVAEGCSGARRVLNPQLLTSLHQETATDLSVEIRKGELLPRLALEADYQIENDPSTILTSLEEVVIRGVVSIPLYQSGLVHSQIRQVKHLEGPQSDCPAVEPFSGVCTQDQDQQIADRRRDNGLAGRAPRSQLRQSHHT